MRILFILCSSLWVHTLPQGFIEAGHEVKISGMITEISLMDMIKSFKPDVAISMGWSELQTIKNQNIIRKCLKTTKIPHIYWSVEDPHFTFEFSIPLLQRLQPDYVFTICPETVKYFKGLGINANYMDFGYATKIHCPVEKEEKYKSTIAVVANAYPDVLSKYPQHFRSQALKTIITPLLKENIKIDFWGNNWDKMKDFLGQEIPKEWIRGYLPYIDANKVYSSSQIMLGLQNYKTQVTQRTYEILASGGFILTMDTQGVRQLFKPGEHLVTTSSPQETLRLIYHYINNPEKCKQIASRGREVVLSHSYKNKSDRSHVVL